MPYGFSIRWHQEQKDCKHQEIKHHQSHDNSYDPSSRFVGVEHGVAALGQLTVLPQQFEQSKEREALRLSVVCHGSDVLSQVDNLSRRVFLLFEYEGAIGNVLGLELRESDGHP